MSYRSGFNHGVSGDAVTTGLTGPLAFANGTVGAHAEVKLPAVASAGIARKVTEKLADFGQLDWYNWSTFSEIRVAFDDGRADAVRPQKYRNAWAASFGGDYAMSQELVLRSGVRFDQTPTVDGSRDTVVRMRTASGWASVPRIVCRRVRASTSPSRTYSSEARTWT